MDNSNKVNGNLPNINVVNQQYNNDNLSVQQAIKALQSAILDLEPSLIHLVTRDAL